MIWFQYTICLHNVGLFMSHKKPRGHRKTGVFLLGSSLEDCSSAPAWSRTVTSTRPSHPWLSPASSWIAPRMHFLPRLQIPVSVLHHSLGETTFSSVRSLPFKLYLVTNILSSKYQLLQGRFCLCIFVTPFE